MAALAALYSVGPVAELLSQLDQEQQLHAALLADMWQMLIVSDVAVQLLAAAAGGEKGLSDAAISLLLSQDTFPHCILPLIKPVSAACLARGSKDQKKQLKQMMLSILGDLEEVWVDESLKDTLMGLPLPAMELLLSCDELKVGSCLNNDVAHLLFATLTMSSMHLGLLSVRHTPCTCMC